MRIRGVSEGGMRLALKYQASNTSNIPQMPSVSEVRFDSAR
jgi:hypothetical protein